MAAILEWGKSYFCEKFDFTKDSALLPVKEKLNKKLGDESIEVVIPELKRIIDSHDNVLKTPYMPKF